MTLTEMFSFLPFVPLWACLWHNQGEGFFRVPILIASLNSTLPKTLGQATFTVFLHRSPCVLIKSLMSIISALGLWTSCQSLPLPSQIPVLYWFQLQSHSLFCSGGDGMFFPWPELKRVSEWGQHNFPSTDNPWKVTEQALGVKNSLSWCASPLQMVLLRVRT